MASVGKRSVMTLYTGLSCPYSHRVRFVLAEKGIVAEHVLVDETQALPEDLLDLNPYGSVPTLVDRDLVLYDTKVITEYLDERFPHPPLMPVDPVSRAKARLVVHRIEHDWYSLLGALDKGGKAADKARKELKESLIASDELFAANDFFLNDEISIMDCVVIPLLWRLPVMGIDLGDQAPAVRDYADRVFSRESFQLCLTERERAMRD